MRLDTCMYVHDEVKVRDLFAECRRLLGATTETWQDRDVSQYYGEGVWSIGNDIGQGLPALLDIKYRPHAPLRTDPDACTYFCDPSDDEDPWHHHTPAMWCEVSFDTAYSYHDSYGGCGALHARLLFDLGQWLDERGAAWSWVNEFDGAVYGGDDRYRKLSELTRGGQEAMRWFKATVEPVIVAACEQAGAEWRPA